MDEKIINVLYVDDEIDNLTGFKAYFRRHYNVFTAISAEQAQVILVEQKIHVLITDQKMPKTVGTKLLEHCMKEYPTPTRILLTAHADNETIIGAFQRGLMCRYILKPYDAVEVKEIIDASYQIYILSRIKEELYKEWLKTDGDINILNKKTEG
jgi:response regulator RpfG family c-di-GMP phosphodiesterase